MTSRYPDLIRALSKERDPSRRSELKSVGYFPDENIREERESLDNEESCGAAQDSRGQLNK